MSLFGYFLSSYDLVVIGFIALLFFGNRLPAMMRNLGQGVTEFKKGMEGHADDPNRTVQGGEVPKKIDDAHPNS